MASLAPLETSFSLLHRREQAHTTILALVCHPPNPSPSHCPGFKNSLLSPGLASRPLTNLCNHLLLCGHNGHQGSSPTPHSGNDLHGQRTKIQCLLGLGSKCPSRPASPSCPLLARALTPYLLFPGRAPSFQLLNLCYWKEPFWPPHGTLSEPYPLFRTCFQYNLIQDDSLSRQGLPPNPTSQ